jgi:hypothetical protein
MFEILFFLGFCGRNAGFCGRNISVFPLSLNFPLGVVEREREFFACFSSLSQFSLRGC